LRIDQPIATQAMPPPPIVQNISDAANSYPGGKWEKIGSDGGMRDADNSSKGENNKRTSALELMETSLKHVRRLVRFVVVEK
jgi:hypothetical protein